MRANWPGLPAKSLEVLHASGATQEQIDSYLQQILANKPEEIGASAADFFADIENARRAVVERLRALAAASPAALAGPTHQTFLVANPSDRDATVTLRVRRASIPPAWAIAIVNADEPAGQKPKYPVREAEPGRTYTLQLPGHAQTRVAAEVTPVGDVAEDTVASWAVEGSIDGAVIGGMMMQMHVPASIPPVQLPPIRSAVDTSAASSTAAASPSAGGGLGSGSTRVSLFIGGAVLLLVVLAAVLVIRSKKGRGADAGS